MTNDLTNQVAVITGAGGAIGGAIAMTLAQRGAQVAIWDLSKEAADEKRESLGMPPESVIALACDVTDPGQVQLALRETLTTFGTIDILVNGAGGSSPQTTTSPDKPFFDLLPEAMTASLNLNYLSAVLPCQSVGRVFAEKKRGVILNISSIAGVLPLTRAISYSNAKAAVNNFTQWLAVHMATEYAPQIRVNAIAPGFVLTKQNRFLLVDPVNGKLTPRGENILRRVPANRFGDAEEIAEAACWLVSDQARFITGAVIPVDGGFTASCGV